MNELDGLLKREKVVQLAVRIISVLTFVGGIVMIKMWGSIALFIFFVGFIIITIIAFRGQKIQKQAKEMYQNSFLENALTSILPQYQYAEKMENPDVNFFRQYGLLSRYTSVSVGEILQVQYPEGSFNSMNVHFQHVYYSHSNNGRRSREVYWGRLLIFATKKNFVGETYITYKKNRYVAENPQRLPFSFNHPQLDSFYNLSATDSQVLALLSDVNTINLLLELAPLNPVICIRNKVACVAIQTQNKIMNYDYKTGFEPQKEYAKLQGEMARERRIMNILQ